MRTNYLKIFLVFGFLCALGLPDVLAQVDSTSASVSGTILDKNGETVPGVSVVIQGTTIGAVTDMSGKYKIEKIPPGKIKLIITSVGFDTQAKDFNLKGGQTASFDTKIAESAIGLKEMVVVGYGTTAKKDLTGSVTSVSSKDFNKGNMATPEQLLTGKLAGVQITSKSGQPGVGSRIRIRGGSSLNASNDPLIVIDGVPLDNGTVNGSGNALSLINPNDIENMTILKDASATAIYGSRGANGVIIITTKKGVNDGKLHVDIGTSTSLSKIIKYADVLSAEEYRTLVTDSGSPAQIKLLGTANTDWQKEIYRQAYGTDNNLSIAGAIKGVPFRLSAGYFNQEGILKRSQFDRKSIGLNLNPTFLKDHIRIDLTTKYTNSTSWFADQGAIGSAVRFDPTKPVYADTTAFNYNPGAAHNAETDNYGGYYEWTDQTSGKPNALAAKNPVGLLYQKEDVGYANRFIGNFGVDYKIHWLPELRAHANVGTDQTWSHGNTFVPETAASSFYDKGSISKYRQTRENYLFDAYLNYVKELGNTIKSKLDLTVGYGKQYWIEKTPEKPKLDASGDTLPGGDLAAAPDNGIRSYYARLNYFISQKYLFTFTYRYDLSSRFAKEVRGGHFPSAAFAWRLKDENFLKDVKFLSDLKLRLGYGIVGQQDGIDNYAYIANYKPGTNTAQYQFGNNFYTVLRPDAYDAKLRWEKSTTYNGGLDIAFFKGRVGITLDFYKKLTKDLLAKIPATAGTNFSNNILTNVGSMENKGFEAGLTLIPIVNKNMEWQVGFNFTQSANKLTKLNKVDDPTSPGVSVGGIAGGTGNNVQIHSIGNPTYTFYVYKQKYDAETGKPIGGTGNPVKDTIAYEDLNGDGKITPDDLYRYNSPAPKFLIGFNSSLTYKRFSLGFSARMQKGGYVYNNVNSQSGNFGYVDGTKNYIDNIGGDYYNTEFDKVLTTNALSDYYVEKADFFKLDYVNAGYSFPNIFDSETALRVSFIVNNVFTKTGYKGIDPEIETGIDGNIYPRPRIYTLGFNLTF